MTCDPFRILRITDGTVSDAGIRNEVDLLSEKSGFCLTEWEPAISMLKGGGVWSDSPISDGRRLRFSKAENVREVMTFEIQDWNADDLIADTQELRRLLEKARAWGTARWQDETVWIEARGVGETNLRYAIVADYRTPRDGNPYEQPFWQRLALAGMSEFQLTLERRPYWLSNEPGTGTATEISALEAYDGRNLGNVDSTGTRDPTTADEVYIANKRNEANLSDLYVDDGGVFTANLMDAALPYNLLPAVPAPNDAVYFGIDTALADSGPFASLVFDIGTAIGATAPSWEYWNGAGWVALTVQDNTNADGAMTGTTFDTTGVKSVHWEQPSDWATVAVNAITGYWVRARVLATDPGPTAPTQQNRDVYSIVWPYVEIQEAQVGGDVPALLRLKLFNESDTVEQTPLVAWSNRIICGSRSLSRGSNFTAYMNFSDEQNPTNITAIVLGLGAFANNVESPTGRVIQSTPFAPPAQNIGRITIGSLLASDYRGQYHGFVRAQQTVGTVGQYSFAIVGRLFGVVEFYNSGSLTFSFTNDWQVFDLGQVTIPSLISGSPSENIIFDIDTAGNAVATAQFYDLILIPIDEWALECLDYVNNTFSRLGGRGTAIFRDYLDINGLTDPKIQSYLIKRAATDEFKASYLGITVTRAILQANSTQRLWFTSMRFPSAGVAEQRSEPWISFSTQAIINQRYISMRGNQ